MKAVIIDDSPQARKLLRLMLQELAPEIKLIAEGENVNEVLPVIEKLQPDVLFLDIEMPGKSGLQLAEELMKNNTPCEIIFTTAYNEYAIQAFRLSAIDYLLKPIDEKLLVDAVRKVKEKRTLLQSHHKLIALTQNLKPTTDPVFCIPVQNGYEYILLKEIEYLEADGSYTHIHLINKDRKTVSKNLKYCEQALESFPNFVRVHRTHLINMDSISSFSKSGGGTITMKCGKQIDLARDRKSFFMDILARAKP